MLVFICIMILALVLSDDSENSWDATFKAAIGIALVAALTLIWLAENGHL